VPSGSAQPGGLDRPLIGGESSPALSAAEGTNLSAEAIHRTETVIIGAGPAGLAVGACLRRGGRSFEVLERDAHVASSWRRHYDRLHLHTDKQNSGLPFRPFSRSTPRYPSREDVIEYLERYARELSVEPRFSSEVTSARREGNEWVVATRGPTYRSRFLVVASGNTREPVRPVFSGQSAYRGEVLHSSEYRNGERFRGKQVLVVGFGNSGGEIAIDLHEHGASPSLAVRGPVNVIPRELLGIPILSIAIAMGVLPPRVADALSAPLLRLALGDLRKLGLQPLPVGPGVQVRTRGRIPLIDVGTIGLIRDGKVRLRPGVSDFTAEGVRFSDGSEGSFDAVVLATGYRPRVSAFLEAPGALDASGAPTASGREHGPGLFFCGFHVSPTGMLREIGIEAQRIGAAIAAHA